jgi:hypothetical protein
MGRFSDGQAVLWRLRRRVRKSMRAMQRGESAEKLRATASLAKLLSKRGLYDEARAILSDIYNWFTEGFDTADLRALLRSYR